MKPVTASAVLGQLDTQAPTLPAPGSVASFAGFIFDPAHFPFTLLETLTKIAKKIGELGLEKTGGKIKDSSAKYSYFEEAEIASYLRTLLTENDIGYASGAPAITGRYENGKTHSGGTMWAHHVKISVVFSHKASGEWIVIPGVGEAADAGDKGVTKAITSAVKYVWMKTFLISDGNDIELNQTENAEPKNTPAQGQAKDTKKKEVKKETPIVNKCQDCGGKITAMTSAKDKNKEIPPEIVAAETKKKFGEFLCGDCAQKRSSGKSPNETGGAGATGDYDYTLEKLTPRHITVKGKKKTVYDLELHGGIKVTDWHESHFEYYKALSKVRGTPIQILFDEKQNGRFTNRDVTALLSLDGEVIENEDGEKIDPSEKVSGSYEEQREQYQNFIGDEDIPF